MAGEGDSEPRKSFKLLGFLDVQSVPCARESVLYGSLGSLVVGLGHFLATSQGFLPPLPLSGGKNQKNLLPPPHHCDTAQMLWKQDERSTQPICPLLLGLSKFTVWVPPVPTNRAFRDLLKEMVGASHFPSAGVSLKEKIKKDWLANCQAVEAHKYPVAVPTWLLKQQQQPPPMNVR
ncbi:hypothetical protein BTVI_138983 [Pitangus sulphuratus]|nr:hypothetical protein BTVI_138983 [Pitangus sulphuratus]